MDADTLAQKRLDAQALAADIVDRGTPLTPGIRRHQIDKLASDLLLSGAMQDTSATDRRRFHRLETTLRPSARQRFVEGKYADAAGDLLQSEQRRIERDLDDNVQADQRAAFAKQRAILSRGSSALATRQKSRAMNTRTPMPVRRSTRKPAASSKMWVTPSGRVTTLAAHRRRSAAARSGGLIGRPRANMPRRGGAFASPSTMIREAAASAVKSALKNYVKPAARKAVKAGSKWAKGAGHRAVNSLSKSGEAALLNMIGSGLNLPGIPRRRVGGAMSRRISRVPGSFRPSASRARVGSGIRLATGRRRPAGRR
jgi:hypothetical protein